MENKLWFKAKRYGWGWYPATVEGWLVIAAYLALVFAGVGYIERILGEVPEAAYYVLFHVGILTAILIYVCWKNGEKPRWRWGGG